MPLASLTNNGFLPQWATNDWSVLCLNPDLNIEYCSEISFKWFLTPKRKFLPPPPIPSLNACRNLKLIKTIDHSTRSPFVFIAREITQTKNKMKGCNFNQIGAIRESMIARIIPINFTKLYKFAQTQLYTCHSNSHWHADAFLNNDNSQIEADATLRNANSRIHADATLHNTNSCRRNSHNNTDTTLIRAQMQAQLYAPNANSRMYTQTQVYIQR